MRFSCLVTPVRRKLRFDGGSEREQRGAQRCTGEQQRMKLGRARRSRSRRVSQLAVIWFLHRNTSLVVGGCAVTVARDEGRRKDRTLCATTAQPHAARRDCYSFGIPDWNIDVPMFRSRSCAIAIAVSYTH